MTMEQEYVQKIVNKREFRGAEKNEKKKSSRRRLNNFGEREFANFAQGQQSPSSLNTQSVLPTIRTNTSNAKYISFEGQ